MRQTVKAFLAGSIIIAQGFETSISTNAAEPVSTEDVVAHAQDAVGVDASLTVKLMSNASGAVSTADGSFAIAQSEDTESLEITSTDSATTLVIEDSEYEAVEGIDTPWAIDARGVTVPTPRWLAGTTWTVGKRYGKFIGKKIGPWGLAPCAVDAGWAWYRSDARSWVRAGDTVAGCFL